MFPGKGVQINNSKRLCRLWACVTLVVTVNCVFITYSKQVSHGSNFRVIFVVDAGCSNSFLLCSLQGSSGVPRGLNHRMERADFMDIFPWDFVLHNVRCLLPN